MALTHPLLIEVGAEALPHTIPYYLADRIKAGIIRWRYPPKSSLREIELAAEFGASRGPVREALRILARISHSKKCIGAPNQRKFFCDKDFPQIRGRPDANRL